MNVMTVLEAQVERQHWAMLETRYSQVIQSLDAGILQTYLVHDSNNDAVWRIITVWESREVLNTLRQSGETPKGVLVFQAAYAEPTLQVFDIVLQAQAAEG